MAIYIYGKEKGSKKRMAPLGRDSFVTNLIYARQFEDSKADAIVERLTKDNPDMVFVAYKVPKTMSLLG